MNNRNQFYKIYSNIPLNLRDEIVAVIEGEPVTWKVAKLEIDSDTKIGKKILEQLDKLEII